MSTASITTNSMLEGNIKQTLMNMTLPMVMGMLMLMTFGLVDTFFVSLLGTQELAAISFTFPVTFTVISLNIGLGIGISAVIGRLLGSNDHANARLVATAALMTVLCLVGLLSVIGFLTIDPIFILLGASPELLIHIHDYMSIWYIGAIFLALPMSGNSVLRASGDTKTPSMIMAAGGAINALLDPLLIFGYGPIEGMGIKGAAIATAIAWGVGLIWVLILLVKRNLMIPRLLLPREFLMNVKGIFTIGIPAAGANMLTPIAVGVVTAIVADFGDAAVAAWGVGGRLESIACIIMFALSMTLPPLISKNFGANKIDSVYSAYKTAIVFILCIQLVIFSLLYLVSDYIANVFTNDVSVASLIILFMTIVPLGYGAQGVVVLTNSAFNAIHKPMAALILNTLRLFIFFVPFCYLGSIWYGLMGLFVGAVLANTVMAALSFMWFRYQIKVLLQTQVSKN